jgi:hypothetical protein
VIMLQIREMAAGQFDSQPQATTYSSIKRARCARN